MSTPRVRLGELLVDAQIISREQLEEVLRLQKQDGRRLGTLLVESGLVTETQVTQILSQQLSVPWVSLYHIDFSRQLLNLVPRELAEKFCLVPIFVRRVRGVGETLYVAMDDPSDESAQREVSQWAELPVRAMIAPPSDIQSAIRVYYGGRLRSGSLSEAVAEEAAEAVQSPTEPPPEEVVATKAIPPPPAEAHEMPPPEVSEPAAAEQAQRDSTEVAASQTREGQPESSRIESREVSMPAPPRRKARMVTLTLLDGTQINLPARRSAAANAPASAKPGAEEQLTARDLVAALRAVSHGADASEILGEEARWEALFAALLSVLLKKHLIADWEFVEEYKKI